jgi:hypothetical protein
VAGREVGGRFPAIEQRTHAMAEPEKPHQPKRRVQKTTRSPAQREASRKNGACSRGPKRPETKRKSSLNSLKLGFYAESEVIPGESIEEYQYERDLWLRRHGATEGGPQFFFAISSFRAAWRYQRGERALHAQTLDDIASARAAHEPDPEIERIEAERIAEKIHQEPRDTLISLMNLPAGCDLLASRFEALLKATRDDDCLFPSQNARLGALLGKRPQDVLEDDLLYETNRWYLSMMRPAELGLKIDNVMGIYADTMPEHSKGYRGDEVKCRINHVLTNELTSSGAEAAALQRQFIAAQISTLRERAARLRREREARAERAAAAAPLSGSVESARRDRHLAMNYRRAEVGSELARKLRKEWLAEAEQNEKTSGSDRPAARGARAENVQSPDTRAHWCGPIREGEPPGEPDGRRGSAGASPSQEPDTLSDVVYQESHRSPLNSPPAPHPAQPPVLGAQAQAEPGAVRGAGGCLGSPPDGQASGGLGLSPGSPAADCAGPAPAPAEDPSRPDHDHPPAAEPPPAPPAAPRTDVPEQPGGLGGGVVPALLLLLLLPLAAGPGRARAPEPPPVRTRALTAAAQAAGRAADRAAESPLQGRRRVGRGPTRRIVAHRQRHGVRWASSRLAASDPSNVPRPPQPARPGAAPASGRLGPGHPRQTIDLRNRHPKGAWGRSPQGQIPDARPSRPAAAGAAPAAGRLIPSHPGQRACLRNPHGQGVRPASHGSDSSLIPHPSSLRSCRDEPESGASRVVSASSSFAIAQASRSGLRPRDSPGLRGPPWDWP